MKRSGEDRLKMGCSMHATSQALVKAATSDKNLVALKRALFLRFYGEEFGPKERRKILLALRKAAERKMRKTREARKNVYECREQSAAIERLKLASRSRL
jgi:hypothetical protein